MIVGIPKEDVVPNIQLFAEIIPWNAFRKEWKCQYDVGEFVSNTELPNWMVDAVEVKSKAGDTPARKWYAFHPNRKWSPSGLSNAHDSQKEKYCMVIYTVIQNSIVYRDFSSSFEVDVVRAKQVSNALVHKRIKFEPSHQLQCCDTICTDDEWYGMLDLLI